MIGIHPNTVRLYEELGLIPKPERQSNRYRVFTEFHLEQFKLARLALQVEVLQNGLRKQVVEIVKTSATGEFDAALQLANGYLLQLRQERRNAEEAIEIAKQLLSGQPQQSRQVLRRKEVSDHLNISMDTLRNWEMNNLLAVKRKENGYRVYTDSDINRLRIIRSLRCANYSLDSILRMLNEVSLNPGANIREILNTPKSSECIISACDKLIVSLQAAEENTIQMMHMLQQMKARFQNPTL